ncbi:MAG: helix-turn-helix transcriptional regulator [Clostridiales bacterium]|jgi:transcriptional regulator with XRE-family HTH domain|nr:helix-turn-helix transcriptional regulator [Clostridiales bacterium]
MKGGDPIKKLNRLLIGERVRKQREALGFKREELAGKIEISTTFMADIENGSKGMGMDTLYRLAQALDVSTDFILTGRMNRDISLMEDLFRRCTDKEYKILTKLVFFFFEVIKILKSDDEDPSC